jgi:5-methylthioribose kinase
VVLDFDEPNRVLILEDLGAAERLDAALARGANVTAAACQIAAFLGRVHRATTGDPSLHPRFRNEDMQRLHGDHIFALPYQDNDFELPPETAARAAELRRDPALVAVAQRAHQRYLTPQGALLHADVQPANVLLCEPGPKLLDAEIAHVGDPAFDVGMLLAHLALPAAARGEAEPGAAAWSAAWRAYCAAHGPGHPGHEATCRYAGLELLRRTVGAARVPAVACDEAGLRVIALGRALAVAPESLSLAGS